MAKSTKDATALSNRKAYLDTLRGLATIGVIIIHVSANNWYGFVGSVDWTIFTVYESLFKVSVPIFFEISGCLYLNSTRNRTIRELYGHSIFKLLVFLLFWSMVYKMIRFPWSSGDFVSNLKIVWGDILKGNTEIHLWFIYAIVGLYVLIPMLKPVVVGASRSNLKYAVIVCFVLGSVCEMVSMFPAFVAITNNLNKIKAGISFGYIGYFLLGAYLDKYEMDKKNRLTVYVLGVLGGIITFGLVYWDCVSSQSLNERFWSYNMPNIFMSSAAIFVYIKNLNISNTFTKVMSKVSKRSLGIYGAHFLFIMLFWKMGFHTFLFTGILSVPIISFSVFILSYIVSVMLHKFPKIGKYIA